MFNAEEMYGFFSRAVEQAKGLANQAIEVYNDPSEQNKIVAYINQVLSPSPKNKPVSVLCLNKIDDNKNQINRGLSHLHNTMLVMLRIRYDFYHHQFPWTIFNEIKEKNKDLLQIESIKAFEDKRTVFKSSFDDAMNDYAISTEQLKLVLARKNDEDDSELYNLLCMGKLSVHQISDFVSTDFQDLMSMLGCLRTITDHKYPAEKDYNDLKSMENQFFEFKLFLESLAETTPDKNDEVDYRDLFELMDKLVVELPKFKQACETIEQLIESKIDFTNQDIELLEELIRFHESFLGWVFYFLKPLLSLLHSYFKSVMSYPDVSMNLSDKKASLDALKQYQETHNTIKQSAENNMTILKQYQDDWGLRKISFKNVVISPKHLSQKERDSDVMFYEDKVYLVGKHKTIELESCPHELTDVRNQMAYKTPGACYVSSNEQLMTWFCDQVPGQRYDAWFTNDSVKHTGLQFFPAQQESQQPLSVIASDLAESIKKLEAIKSNLDAKTTVILTEIFTPKDKTVINTALGTFADFKEILDNIQSKFVWKDSGEEQSEQPSLSL